VDATSPAGAAVSFPLPTATDNAPEPVSVGCAPSSSTTFAIGTTKVVCTATDGSGNTALASFTVTVENTFASLCRVTRLTERNPGIANSLCVKLEAASDAVDRGSQNAAAAELGAYEHEVAAQSGVSFDANAAGALLGLADLLSATISG
jgi:hypothetical protein